MKSRKKLYKRFDKNLKKCSVLLMATALLGTSMGFENIVNAMEDTQFIDTKVSYNDDKTQADIEFDIDSVDKEKYEVTQITSDKDGSVIYEKSETAEINEQTPVIYSVAENGTYDFTVKYMEIQEADEQETLPEDTSTATDSIEENNAESTQNETSDEQAVKEDLTESEEKTTQDTVTESQENSTITVEKEEKVTVEINEIGQVTEELNATETEGKTNQSENTRTIQNSVSPRLSAEPRADGLVNIDLSNEYYVYSKAWDVKNQTGKDIPNMEKQISKNRIRLMTPESSLFNGGAGEDDSYDYQTTAIRSKKTFDLTRPFTMKGNVYFSEGIYGASDGFAISFTNNSDYVVNGKIDSGGSLGAMGTDGIKNGIVAEIDTYGNDNSPNEGNNHNWKGRKEGWDDAHLDIQGIKGTVTTTLTKDYDVYDIGWNIEPNADYLKNNHEFILTCVPTGTNRATITLSVGDYKAVAENIDLKQYFGNPKAVYLGFSGVTGNENNYPYKPIESTFTFESFKYTDVQTESSIAYIQGEDPDYPSSNHRFNVSETYELNKNVKDRDVRHFMQPGQKYEVKYTFRNLKNSTVDLKDILYINDLKINKTELEIVPGSVHYTVEDGRSGKIPTFDKNHPIEVFYPKNCARYDLYFQILIPENFSYDITQSPNKQLPYVEFIMSIGQKGMSQHPYEKNLSYISKPLVKGLDKSVDVNSGNLEDNYASKNLAQARTYDDLNLHALYDGGANGFATEAQGWMRFNYSTGQFEGILEQEFMSHSKTTKGETDLYLYRFRANDSRRASLAAKEPVSDEGYGRYFLTKGNVTAKNGYKLLLSNDTITISGNDIINKYNSSQKLLNYLENQLSIKAYNDDGGMNVTKADRLALNSAGLNFSSPDAKTYSMNVDVYDSNYNSGNSVALSKQINVIVTPVATPNFNFLNGIHVDGNGNSGQNVAVSYDVNDLNKYVVPGNEITVRFNITSDNQTDNKLKAKLTIGKLQIPDTNITLTPKELSYTPYRSENGSSVIDGATVSKGDVKVGQEVNVELPAKGKFMAYQFKVTIPKDASIDIKSFTNGKLPYLETSVSLQTIGSSKTVTKDLNMAIASKPFAHGYDTKSTVGTGISKNNLLTNGHAKTYDENLDFWHQWHKLSELNGTNLKVNSEKYYRFDEKQNKFVEAIESDLTKNQTETGIYAYEFDVKDTRHNGKNNGGGLISDKGMVRNFVGNKTATSDGKYVLLTSKDSITLSETKISKDLYSKDLFEQYIMTEMSVKGYIDNQGLNVSQATKIGFNHNGFDFTNPKEGAYTMHFDLYDGTSVKLSKTFTLNITSNTWSYDTDDRTEENGASGYIVIPKNIELEKTADKKHISSTEEVFFASYPNATSVRYNLYVDKTFELVKQGNPSNKVEVVSSSESGSDSSDNRWLVGEMNYRYIKGYGHKITFTASSDEVDKSKGLWTGNVTFYFERIS